MARGTYVLDKEKIKRMAFDKGWSMTNLCEEAEVSNTVFFRKTSYPRTVKKLAEALGVQPSEIIKAKVKE